MLVAEVRTDLRSWMLPTKSWMLPSWAVPYANAQLAVKVQWLYSAGTGIPIQDYYGAKELFQSKHHDIVRQNSLTGKCNVEYNVAD